MPRLEGPPPRPLRRSPTIEELLEDINQACGQITGVDVMLVRGLRGVTAGVTIDDHMVTGWGQTASAALADLVDKIEGYHENVMRWHAQRRDMARKIREQRSKR